jgi:hypothetical protein
LDDGRPTSTVRNNPERKFTFLLAGLHLDGTPR